MINFNALDFTVCRSEEGKFLLTLSVYWIHRGSETCGNDAVTPSKQSRKTIFANFSGTWPSGGTYEMYGYYGLYVSTSSKRHVDP